ncbi:MAG: ATP-binding protein [Betaproteobacteria bacterium]|nr:ATP-binding protein [Betaproteobacteria bacterium]
MRLLPASLFGRLVLVLVGGLVLAVAIGAATYLRERGALLEQAGAIGVARRIADAIRVLDAQSPAARERTAESLGSATLGVSLEAAPSEPARGAAGGPYARQVAGLVEAYLGEHREIRVAQGFAMPPMRMAPGMAPPMPMAGMPHAMMARPLAVQVRLRDGTWARFSYAIPPPRVAWPFALIGETLALVLAVIVLSIVAVRRATRPLAVLASAADELGADINRPPLPEQGPDEVRRAARAFNSMQARLKGYIEDRGRILAAIAHDLKTPLALLRLRAEALPEDAELRAQLEGDVQRMERLVSETLDFVRALDSPEPARAVDVLALLESLKADTQALGWQVDIGGSARPFTGRVQALQRCIANLVENAVRYGKRARVTLEDSEEALRVRIRDAGPGIPETELERVFEPFYRLETSRNPATGGAGLGLAIARTIARAHGGNVVLHNAEGGGLEALLTLPRRRAERPAPRSASAAHRGA